MLDSSVRTILSPTVLFMFQPLHSCISRFVYVPTPFIHVSICSCQWTEVVSESQQKILEAFLGICEALKQCVTITVATTFEEEALLDLEM